MATTWCDWNYTTSSTNTATVWYNWNDITTTTSTWDDTYNYYYRNYIWDRWNPPQNIAIHNADKQREEEYKRQVEERIKREHEAKEVAEQLLLENLTEEQREMYLKLKKFHVISSEGVRFEIECNKKWHNIFELDEKGKRKTEHCIHTPGVPLGDNHLAQKLLLETNEKRFREIANQTNLIRA